MCAGGGGAQQVSTLKKGGGHENLYPDSREVAQTVSDPR